MRRKDKPKMCMLVGEYFQEQLRVFKVCTSISYDHLRTDEDSTTLQFYTETVKWLLLAWRQIIWRNAVLDVRKELGLYRTSDPCWVPGFYSWFLVLLWSLDSGDVVRKPEPWCCLERFVLGVPLRRQKCRSRSVGRPPVLSSEHSCQSVSWRWNPFVTIHAVGFGWTRVFVVFPTYVCAHPGQEYL